MRRGLVFDIQRFSVKDGPGIRTTVFLKGCPLACAWCHNPEGMTTKPDLMLSPDRCVRCGACVDVCPASPCAGPAAERGSDPSRCTGCGACVEACPTGARHLAGRLMGVDELLDEVERDRVFYDESGGGVTFSGGEPTMQVGFLLAALEACGRAGIHSAVDTSGACDLDDLLAVAKRTDLVLFDVKVMDPERHLRCTGVSNEGLLANLRALARCHDQIWLRVPVVPGINDDEENMAATARLAVSLPAVRRVHLLPYHRFGSHKRSRLGVRRAQNGLRPPTAERLQSLAGQLAAAGIESHIGG